MDFGKYRLRLREYLAARGVEARGNLASCFNRGAHAHGDEHPSLLVYEDHFQCQACGIKGDIYDAAGMLEGIADKKEQYLFVEKFFGDSSYIPPPPPTERRERFIPDGSVIEGIVGWMDGMPGGKKNVREFLRVRARKTLLTAGADYPGDTVPYLMEQFHWWPGLDAALDKFSVEDLVRAGILADGGEAAREKSAWRRDGAVVRLGAGLKLHYYDHEGKCAKRASRGGQSFPMPGAVDLSRPVILVEGEIDALSSRAAGIENVFACGGTSGLTGPLCREHLLGAGEVVFLFDADAAGRFASGASRESPDAGKALPAVRPDILLDAGYTGVIRVAELPLDGPKDPDALVLHGRREAIVRALAEAREYKREEGKGRGRGKGEKERGPAAGGKGAGRESRALLACILKKVPPASLAAEDFEGFVLSGLAVFKAGWARDMFRKWGAGEGLLRRAGRAEDFSGFAKKYLSYYLRRKAEGLIEDRSDLPASIKVQGSEIPLEYEEIDFNEHANDFVNTVGVRSGAEMLGDIFNGKIIYDDAKGSKRFYFFDGVTWVPESDVPGIAYNICLGVMRYFGKKRLAALGAETVVDAEGDEDGTAEKERKRRVAECREYFKKAERRLEQRRIRVEIVQELSGLKQAGVYHNSDDTAHDTLVFDNYRNIAETVTLGDCVMDMRGERLVFRPAEPGEWRYGKLKYGREEVEGAPLPERFLEFMAYNIPDEATREMALDYFSLIATRMPYKQAAFFIGDTDTGKTATVKLLQAVYGEIIGTLAPDAIAPVGRVFSSAGGPNPFLADIEGYGCVVANDVEDKAVLNEGEFKRLTGDDPIKTRGLNRDPRTFRNTARIILVANKIPKFNLHDAALLRRIMVVPFLVDHRNDKARKSAEQLDAELRGEYPGIVKYLAERYIRLRREVLSTQEYIPTSRLSEREKVGVISEVESDFDTFMRERVIFAAGASESGARLYEAYLGHVGVEEEDARRGDALTRAKFSRLVHSCYGRKAELKNMRINGESVKGWRGLRLKTAEEDAAAEEEEMRRGAEEDLARASTEEGGGNPFL